jgi:hypothetical protein
MQAASGNLEQPKESGPQTQVAELSLGVWLLARHFVLSPTARSVKPRDVWGSTCGLCRSNQTGSSLDL